MLSSLSRRILQQVPEILDMLSSLLRRIMYTSAWCRHCLVGFCSTCAYYQQFCMHIILCLHHRLREKQTRKDSTWVSQIPILLSHLQQPINQNEVHICHYRRLYHRCLCFRPSRHLRPRKSNLELGTNELTTNAKQQLFAYPSCFVLQQPTALQGHFLGGYKPVVVPPPPAHGFSGFGHATGENAEEPVAAAPVVEAPPEPIFSGFGHSDEEMGGSKSIMSK